MKLLGFLLVFGVVLAALFGSSESFEFKPATSAHHGQANEHAGGQGSGYGGANAGFGFGAGAGGGAGGDGGAGAGSGAGSKKG